jgi:hypothetical protein
MRANDLMCLAVRAIEALGVNGAHPDAAHIMQHSIAQACLELEAVEAVLEKDINSTLVYIVMGIRQRLELAGQSAGLLATLIAEGNEAAE